MTAGGDRNSVSVSARMGVGVRVGEWRRGECERESEGMRDASCPGWEMFE